MLLNPNLLGSKLLGGKAHSHLSHCLGDTEFSDPQDCVLTWLESDFGRSPTGKSRGADDDLIGGCGLKVIEFKESVVIRSNRAGALQSRALDNHRRAWNGVVVHIHDSSDNNTWLRPGRLRQWKRLLLSLRGRSAKAEHEDTEEDEDKGTQLHFHVLLRMREIRNLGLSRTQGGYWQLLGQSGVTVRRHVNL
jgi:hypothetical protein